VAKETELCATAGDRLMIYHMFIQTLSSLGNNAWLHIDTKNLDEECGRTGIWGRSFKFLIIYKVYCMGRHTGRSAEP
jgi:hypothetical protein